MQHQGSITNTKRNQENHSSSSKGGKRVFRLSNPKNDHHEPTKKKENQAIQQSNQKSLARWKSNPNLLMTNSYIKLADVESVTLQSLIQNLSDNPKERSKLNRVKSEETFQPFKPANKSRDRK